jgi:RNA polymerase sigma factor (TIGR02999 family)
VRPPALASLRGYLLSVAADESDAIAVLLGRLKGGDRSAFDELFPLVYEDLRRLARSQRRRSRRPSPTLNTTALVHEAYLKLASKEDPGFAHRGGFFSVAAVAMRHILVDQARRHLREKRGGGEHPLDLESNDVCVEGQAEWLVALDASLDRLEERSPRLRQVVEYRFFGGLTEEEIAGALDVTSRTVRRDWTKAKAWLAIDLDDGNH